MIKKLSTLLPLAVIVFFGAAYSVLVLHRYWQFEYFSIDNVYFHNALWQLQAGKVPMVQHDLLGTIPIFGDHFHPTISFVALLLRIFPFQETILLSMVWPYTFAAWFAYRTARNFGLSNLIATSLLFPYFLYIATQNAMIYGFHEINLMPLFFFITLHGLSRKSSWQYWVGFILLLLTKETLVGVALGISLFLLISGRSEWKRKGFISLLISITYYFLVTKLIIPAILGGPFLYGQQAVPPNLIEFIRRLYLPYQKIQTFLISLLSFGFLPVGSLAVVPLVLQDFVMRFVFSLPTNVQYTLTYHYGVGLAPLLLFASIWVLSRHIVSLKPALQWIFSGLIIIMAFAVQWFGPHKGPLMMVFNRGFYQTTANNQFLHEVINAVPPKGTVMTMNHLALPLSKQKVYLWAKSNSFLKEYNPDYIVFDLRPGQNPNNYFPLTEDSFRTMSKEIQNNPAYSVIYQRGDQFIYAKNSDLP